MEKNKGDLQFHEDMERQERAWKIKRAVWGGMSVLLLAALAGLVGSGPLSQARAEGEGVSIDYQRFLRRQAPAEITLTIQPEPTAEKLRISLNEKYIHQVDPRHILPQPERMETAGDRVVFVFHCHSNKPASVSFSLEPRAYGFARAEVSVEGGGSSPSEVCCRGPGTLSLGGLQPEATGLAQLHGHL